MTRTHHLLYQTRRRFLGMLGGLGALLSWPVLGRPPKSRLSGREAAFYRKGRRPGP
jgi:hypothetical protein